MGGPASRAGAAAASALDLKQFILRREVLTLYRDYLRLLKSMEVSNARQKGELRVYVRGEFERHRGLVDAGRIRHELQHGRLGLKELEQTVNLSG